MKQHEISVRFIDRTDRSRYIDRTVRIERLGGGYDGDVPGVRIFIHPAKRQAIEVWEIESVAAALVLTETYLRYTTGDIFAATCGAEPTSIAEYPDPATILWAYNPAHVATAYTEGWISGDRGGYIQGGPDRVIHGGLKNAVQQLICNLNPAEDPRPWT